MASLTLSQHNFTVSSVRLYELLRAPSYTMIVYTSPEKVNAEVAELTRLLALAAQDGVSVHVVLDAGLPKQHELGANVLIDYKGELEQKLSVQPGEVFLLRPDAYIAFQSNILKVEDVTTNWRRWIGK